MHTHLQNHLHLQVPPGPRELALQLRTLRLAFNFTAMPVLSLRHLVSPCVKRTTDTLLQLRMEAPQVRRLHVRRLPVCGWGGPGVRQLSLQHVAAAGIGVGWEHGWKGYPQSFPTHQRAWLSISGESVTDRS